MSFLEESGENWEDSESYNAAKLAVKNRKVINDAAERGVKITADFLDQAKKKKTDFKISFKS